MARTKDFDEDEVLKKAVDLFWRKGYNATSMQDLVDGLGISRSSLYDTFGDKHSLFVRALKKYQQENTGRFCDIINVDRPAKETLRILLENIARQLAADANNKGCFMVNAEVEVAAYDQQVGQIICSNDQQVEDVFFQVISNGQKKGEIKNTSDARALARFIFNTVKGLRVTAKSTNDLAVFSDIIRMAVSILD